MSYHLQHLPIQLHRVASEATAPDLLSISLAKDEDKDCPLDLLSTITTRDVTMAPIIIMANTPNMTNLPRATFFSSLAIEVV